MISSKLVMTNSPQFHFCYGYQMVRWEDCCRRYILGFYTIVFKVSSDSLRNKRKKSGRDNRVNLELIHKNTQRMSVDRWGLPRGRVRSCPCPVFDISRPSHTAAAFSINSSFVTLALCLKTSVGRFCPGITLSYSASTAFHQRLSELWLFAYTYVSCYSLWMPRR